MLWTRLRAAFARLAERVEVPGWVRTAVGVVILLAVVGAFGQRIREAALEAQEVWQPVSWLYVALSFASVLISLLVMAVLWYGLLRTLGAKIPALSAVRFYGLTLLPRYVPGMVWGYVGRTLLCERAGIPRGLALTSVVVEVALIVSSAAIVAGMIQIVWGWRLLLGLLGALLLFGAAMAWVRHRRPQTPRLARLSPWYGWMLAYIGFWLLYGLSSWFVVLAVAPMTDVSAMPAIAVSAVLAWLSGFIVIVVPGGLGIRESVFALTLTPIIGSSKALLVPLLARLVSLAAEAVFFACCVVLAQHNHPSTGSYEAPRAN